MPLFGSSEKPTGNTQEKKKLTSLAEMQQKALADLAEKGEKKPTADHGATPLNETKLDDSHTGGLLTRLRKEIKAAERDARPEWRKRAEDEGLPMKDYSGDKSVEPRRG